VTTAESGRPTHPRRALLTGGAVGLAAIAAGATLSGAQPARAGTQTLSWITPTGDTTGKQDAAAINSALQSTGVAWLGPGSFYINEVIDIPHQGALWGVGPLTQVYCVPTNPKTNPPSGLSGFYMHDTAADGGYTDADLTANSVGSVRDLLIDGSSAVAGSIGLDIGDGWGYRLDHVYVQNFFQPGSIGIRIGNDVYYTEKMRSTDVVVRNCATHVYMNTTENDISHGYNDLEFSFWLLPENTVQNGTVIGQRGLWIDEGVNYYGGSLTIRGNSETVTSAFPTPQDGGPFVIGLTGSNGSNGYSQLNLCRLDIRIEGDAGNEYAPMKLYYGATGNNISDCYGLFQISGGTGGSGDTNGQTGQFDFAGIIIGADLVAIWQAPPDWYS
jgi:hypothetical protein